MLASLGRRGTIRRMKQIVCMKWGTRYSADYVNRLFGMVARNTSPPFRFVCMTDDPAGVDDRIETWDCPNIDIPEPHRHRGWRKVTLFAERLGDLTGEVLFLDLDIVIVDNIDAFFEYGEGFVVMKNWSQPGARIGNTSVYRFTVGEHPYLLEQLEADPDPLIAKHVNSQTYISRTIRGMTFWPDAWCSSFKVHCVPGWPARYWRVPTPPAGAKVVIFPGKPDPDDAAVGRWPAPWYKQWYKTLRPAPWIDQHWRPADPPTP